MVTTGQAIILGVGATAIVAINAKAIGRWVRAARYFRGSKVERTKRVKSLRGDEGLAFGNRIVPYRAANQHFLFAGVTGSGKTQSQRILLRNPLLRLADGLDERMLINDAKGDVVPYLKKIGVTAPVYSFNPFEARSSFPEAVGWNAGRDITSPTRAMNFAAAMIPESKNSGNPYFRDAPRLVSAELMKSLIRHNSAVWTFSDFVSIALNRELLRQALYRDPSGKRAYDKFLPADKTGNDVYASLCTRVGYFEPVAALWKSTRKQLSLREWLGTSSVLLLGRDATAKVVLEVLNGQLFKFFADEVDVQTNSSTRRTYVWIEEAREAKGVIETDEMQQLANKGRSKGVVLVLAFQSIEGFYAATGEDAGDSLISQCGHKALLKMGSKKSAKWASELVGEYEALELMRSDGNSALGPEGKSEQRVQKDAVLPSEFYSIPPTTPKNGLTGYYLVPDTAPRRVWTSPAVVGEVAVDDELENAHAIVYRDESDQWLPEITSAETERLGLEVELANEQEPLRKPSKKLRLRSGASWSAADLSQVESIEQAYLMSQAAEGLEH